MKMITSRILTGSGGTISCLLATTIALGATTAQAATFWLGKGEDFNASGSWRTGNAPGTARVPGSESDNFYFRDAGMTNDTGVAYTAYKRKAKLTKDTTLKSGNMIFFQCGSESDSFVLNGNGKT